MLDEQDPCQMHRLLNACTVLITLNFSELARGRYFLGELGNNPFARVSAVKTTNQPYYTNCCAHCPWNLTHSYTQFIQFKKYVPCTIPTSVQCTLYSFRYVDKNLMYCTVSTYKKLKINHKNYYYHFIDMFILQMDNVTPYH